VIHDDEGYWLICDGVNDPNVPGASGLFNIDHLASIDPSIADTAALPIGFVARRSSPQSSWTFSEFSYEDE
jgi:hypothetical protein